MKCLDANTVAAFVEGLLSAEEVEGVEHHVDRCDDCRRLLSRLAADLSAPSPTSPRPASADAVSPPSSATTWDAAESWRRLAETETGRFELVRPLGSGAMGAVYEVIDRRGGEPVALKTLKSVSPSSLYRFKREFRALAGVDHPNLVPLYELVQQSDLWFFTMELVDGVDFLTFVCEGAEAVTDSERMREVLFQLCEGVAALHEAGVVHRDIKPSNVLVTSQGRVVILDFGLATAGEAEIQSTAGGLAGTVVYMSPEQAAEDQATAASDWYAVGIMMYQALTGQLPFCGPTAKVLTDKQRQDARPPSELNREVEPDLNQLCLDLLRREPSERPTGHEVLERLASARPDLHRVRHSPLSRVCGAERFVGRSAELEALRGAWADVLEHRSPRVAPVSGASGIGKTALAECFLSQLESSDGPVVLRGRCHERETVPYKGFDALVDELTSCLRKLDSEELLVALPREVRHLSSMFPVLNRLRALKDARFDVQEIPEPSERRKRAFRALRDVLRGLTRRHPVVLFIDDLQWADHDSLELLRVLASDSELGPLLLLLAYRDEDPARVEELEKKTDEAAGRASPLSLGPLSAEESSLLTSRLLGDSGESATWRSIIREAGGSPFFIRELVRFLRGHHGREGASAALDTVVAERLRRLPETARLLVSLLSVAGESTPKTLLAEAAGLSRSSSEWVDGLSTLRTESLIREHGPRDVDGVEPYHDKIREQVLAELDVDVLASHHRRLARAVEQVLGEDVDLLARHWEGAGDPSRALDHVRRAARAASEKLAFDRASKLYRSALAMVDDRESKAELGRSLGDALSNAGRPGEAAAAYREAIEHADERNGLKLRQLAAKQLLTGGYVAEGLAEIGEVLDEVGIRLPRGSAAAFRSLLYRRLKLALRGLRFTEREPSEIPQRDRILMDTLYSVSLGLTNTDIVRGFDTQTLFLLEALKHGDVRRIADGLVLEAASRVAVGTHNLEAARELVTRAELLARKAGDEKNIGMAVGIRGIIEFYGGDWRTCIAWTSKAGDILKSRSQGTQYEFATFSWFRFLGLIWQGRLKELAEVFEEHVAEAEGLGHRYSSTTFKLVANIVWLARDDPSRAFRDIAGTLATWPERRYCLQHYFYLLARVDQLLYQGDAEAAWAMLQEDLPKIKRSLLIKNVLLRTWVNRVMGRAAAMIAAATGNPRTKRTFLKHARRMVNALKRDRMTHTTAWAELIDAAVHCQEARLDPGAVARRLDDAIAHLEVAHCPAIAAAARRKKGERIGGQAGKELIAAADGWFAEQDVRNPARFAEFLAPGFRVDTPLDDGASNRGRYSG